MEQVMLWVVALIGMGANWGKRYLTGQTRSNFWVYFFIRQRRRSLAALSTMVVSVVTFLSTWDGALSWGVAYSVFLTGYAADSVANKG